MLINRKVIKPFFKPAYFSRGETYFNEKRVHHISVDESEEFISGLIRGNGRRYSAEIQLHTDGNKIYDSSG